MHSTRDRLARRSFLEAVSAGFAGVLTGPAFASTAAEAVELSAEHRETVNRRRRIVVQYDPQDLFGIDFETWIDYRFRYIDEPGTQIDSVFWDMGRLGQVLYPSKFLDPLVNADFQKWRNQGIDVVGRLVAETRKRGLEVFWHHRASEVDLNVQGTGAAWKDEAAPLKQAHPDWALKTNWWRHGLWNFAVPAVREYTVKALREVAEMYNFDGLQIDFARHVPCLPLGRQWELRHHVTELMRMARRMTLEVERDRGQPLLLAAKVPRNLEGCRIDGFDVEAWAKENLVDILTLGSRSVDVDVAAFQRITAGRNIKLQPCFDDHHTTDGYRYGPIEVLRGVFANWWQQGADSVVTFNWSNAPPEVCKQFERRPGPISHQQAYHEVGNLATMQFKDKTFIVERRGGYPWAEGFFNRNDTAPLPLKIARGGAAAMLRVRISDDLKQHADRVHRVLLRAVLFGASDEEAVEADLNGTSLPVSARDPHWKDPQVFSPKPQPASGGSGIYQVNPRQRLLRLEFALNPRQCRLGENLVRVRLPGPAKENASGEVILEKLEIQVQYAERV
ncbi:MAG: family 10 glycosylhydrolase [Planctomycetota bacterium]